MYDFVALDERPTRSAIRRKRREEKRSVRLSRLEGYRKSLRGQQEAKARRAQAEAFAKAEQRRLRQLYERRVVLATTLAESVLSFEVKFPEFRNIDLNRVRMYMLGESHSCIPLPLELGMAVGNYRRDLLVTQLRTEPAVDAVRQMTSQQLSVVIDTMTARFDELVELSNGLRNCGTWHPYCRHTNDHVQSRHQSRRTASRRWHRNVLKVYILTVGLAAVVELYSYAQIPQPCWLRQLISRTNVRLVA